MRILITGGDGFIGRNLRVRLSELGFSDVVNIEHEATHDMLTDVVQEADFVYHLAGVNRPRDLEEFDLGNREVTARLCEALRSTGRRIPLVYSSSIQATLDNPYGKSKRAGEVEVERYGAYTKSQVSIFRLPNVFGKWCRPNYNSAVATFCHSLVHGLPITINDPNAPVLLVYVDDVVTAMIRLLATTSPSGYLDVEPTYTVTVGEIVGMLTDFSESRNTLMGPPVGSGLGRALYATYMSYLPPEQFAYDLPRHTDPRGSFVEVLKTPEYGQFSYFTAMPGATRGGHYHHTKSEKFLVLTGQARFGFRHIITDEYHEIRVSGEDARVIETVPGWAHNITNTGPSELIVLLWANEVFDVTKPDTIALEVQPKDRETT